MTIFFIFIFIFFRSFFVKNNTLSAKAVFKKLMVILSSQYDYFFHKIVSLKFFIKVYCILKSTIEIKKIFSFKQCAFFFFLINNFNNKIILLKIFLKQKSLNKINKLKPVLINTKLNLFLKKNFLKSKQILKQTPKSIYFINYKPSSMVKLIINNTSNILFLRKNKIFNKGRYSRNRQLYRTGVYWCIWLSVFLGYCLYFSFYRFSFNFGYQWWLIFLFLFLFVSQKMFKYNLYNVSVIFIELKKNFNWISIFFKNLFKR